MTERSIEHAGFTIQRRYGAAPERVFAAWADPAAKARWFAGPEEWDVAPHELDFREGGRGRRRRAQGRPDAPLPRGLLGGRPERADRLHALLDALARELEREP